MRIARTAIILLRESGPAVAREMIEAVLRSLRGVRDIRIEPRECLVTVSFDDRITGLAEIVRSIEDAGPVVSSVAERPVPQPAGDLR